MPRHPRRDGAWACAWLWAVCAVPVPARAAQPVPAPLLRAEILARVVEFVDWPEGSFRDAAQPFRLCVLDRPPLLAELEKLARARRFKGRSGEVRELADFTGKEGCHLLYIPRSQEERLSKLLGRAARRAVLSISETRSSAAHGSVVAALYPSGGRLRLAVNPGAARSAGLRLSGRLVAVAELVR